jgi:hypothetical protein
MRSEEWWEWYVADAWVAHLENCGFGKFGALRNTLRCSPSDSEEEELAIQDAMNLSEEYEQEYLVWRTKRRLLGEK